MISYKNIKIFKGVENQSVEILDWNEKTNIVEYLVLNTPICQFDQHSRARVGIQFLDYKVSEEPEYSFYTVDYDHISKNTDIFNKTFSTLEKLEINRSNSIFKTNYNLMSRNCSYRVIQTYASLKGQMSRRLKLCEEEFIVSLHWMLKKLLIEAGSENAAKDFLPGCDVLGYCDYASADYLSNMFGCLFASCGRWPSNTEFASFNQSCTTPQLIREQTGIIIDKSKYEIENGK